MYSAEIAMEKSYRRGNPTHTYITIISIWNLKEHNIPSHQIRMLKQRSHQPQFQTPHSFVQSTILQPPNSTILKSSLLPPPLPPSPSQPVNPAPPPPPVPFSAAPVSPRQICTRR